MVLLFHQAHTTTNQVDSQFSQLNKYDVGCGIQIVAAAHSHGLAAHTLQRGFYLCFAGCGLGFLQIEITAIGLAEHCGKALTEGRYSFIERMGSKYEQHALGEKEVTVKLF